jgi:hypothetical protein
MSKIMETNVSFQTKYVMGNMINEPNPKIIVMIPLKLEYA